MQHEEPEEEQYTDHVDEPSIEYEEEDTDYDEDNYYHAPDFYEPLSDQSILDEAQNNPPPTDHLAAAFASAANETLSNADITWHSASSGSIGSTINNIAFSNNVTEGVDPIPITSDQINEYVNMVTSEEVPLSSPSYPSYTVPFSQETANDVAVSGYETSKPKEENSDSKLTTNMVPLCGYLNAAYNTYCEYLFSVSATTLSLPIFFNKTKQTNRLVLEKNVMDRINRSFYDKNHKVQLSPHGFIQSRFLLPIDIKLTKAYTIEGPYELTRNFRQLLRVGNALSEITIPILKQIALDKKFIYPVARKSVYVIANLDYESTHISTFNEQEIKNLLLGDLNKLTTNQIDIRVQSLMQLMSTYNLLTESLRLGIKRCYKDQERNIALLEAKENFYKEKDLQNSLYTW